MASYSSSPPGPGLYRATSNQPAPSVRIARLKSFLPLSEEATYSTRGQKLPNIIRNRSTANLTDALRNALPRRQSTILKHRDGPDLEHGHEDEESTSEAPLAPVDFPLLLPGEGRRTSTAVTTLMTPQMRSQRLIGNSNPRYEWYTIAALVRMDYNLYRSS